MKGLTQKQLEVVKAIELYTKENGIAPTIRELQALLGLRSPATVHNHIKALKTKGALLFDEKTPRSLLLAAQKEEQEGTIPLFGTLSQKNGIEPFQKPPKISISSSLVKNFDTTYALRVKGDWLSSELIGENDLIIIEATSTLIAGSLILGQQGTQLFIKRVFPEGRSVRLANIRDSGDITIPLNELQILGIVTSLIRNYEELS